MSSRRFNWQILQMGNLALTLTGAASGFSGRCTSVLIWPELASMQGSVLVDPCFEFETYHKAEQWLEGQGMSFVACENVFITHKHVDHLIRVPDTALRTRLTTRWLLDAPLPNGIVTYPVPGHHPEQRALVFEDTEGQQTWVVGDAILDETWLREWRYYRPNGYRRAEIVQTWRTVAMILSQADVIVPGHGAPIRVSDALIEDVLTTLPQAEHIRDCPDVRFKIQSRLKGLSSSLPVA